MSALHGVDMTDDLLAFLVVPQLLKMHRQCLKFFEKLGDTSSNYFWREFKGKAYKIKNKRAITTPNLLNFSNFHQNLAMYIYVKSGFN